MQIMKRTVLVIGCTFSLAGIAGAETGTGPESAMGVGGPLNGFDLWVPLEEAKDEIGLLRHLGASDATGLYVVAKRGSDDGPDHDADDDHGGNSGKGGGGDDDTRDHGSGNDDDGSSGSGRSKPRIPGGSGCDDPGDVAEHSECQG